MSHQPFAKYAVVFEGRESVRKLPWDRQSQLTSAAASWRPSKAAGLLEAKYSRCTWVRL